MPLERIAQGQVGFARDADSAVTLKTNCADGIANAQLASIIRPAPGDHVQSESVKAVGDLSRP